MRRLLRVVMGGSPIMARPSEWLVRVMSLLTKSVPGTADAENLTCCLAIQTGQTHFVQAF